MNEESAGPGRGREVGRGRGGGRDAEDGRIDRGGRIAGQAGRGRGGGRVAEDGRDRVKEEEAHALILAALVPLRGEAHPAYAPHFIPDILGVDDLLERLAWAREEVAEWRTEVITRAENFAAQQQAEAAPARRHSVQALEDLNDQDCASRLLRGLVGASEAVHAPKTSVRTFVSAPFENFKFEGDVINAIVVPTMRAYCQQLGLTFDLMTMRFGVNGPQNLEHQTVELCAKYVKACFDEGTGPAFVYLQGERIASPTFPSEVPEQYFQGILSKLGRPRLPVPWAFVASEIAWGKNYDIDVKEEDLLKDMWLLDESTDPSLGGGIRRLRPKCKNNPPLDEDHPVLHKSWWEYSLDLFLEGEALFRDPPDLPRPHYARRVGLTTTGVEVDVALSEYSSQLMARAVRVERTIEGLDAALGSDDEPVKAAAEVYKDAMSNKPLRELWEREHAIAEGIPTHDALKFSPQWVDRCVERRSRAGPDARESALYPWFFRSSNG